MAPQKLSLTQRKLKKKGCPRHEGEEEVLVMINLETAEVKEIADYFSHEVNNFSFNPKSKAPIVCNRK